MNKLTAHALGFGGSTAPAQPTQGTGDILHHLVKAHAAHKKGDHAAARKHALNYANASMSQMSQAPGGAPGVADAAGGTSAPTPGGV